MSKFEIFATNIRTSGTKQRVAGFSVIAALLLGAVVMCQPQLLANARVMAGGEQPGIPMLVAGPGGAMFIQDTFLSTSNTADGKQIQTAVFYTVTDGRLKEVHADNGQEAVTPILPLAGKNAPLPDLGTGNVSHAAEQAGLAPKNQVVSHVKNGMFFTNIVHSSGASLKTGSTQTVVCVPGSSPVTINCGRAEFSSDGNYVISRAGSNGRQAVYTLTGEERFSAPSGSGIQVVTTDHAYAVWLDAPNFMLQVNRL